MCLLIAWVHDMHWICSAVHKYREDFAKFMKWSDLSFAIEWLLRQDFLCIDRAFSTTKYFYLKRICIDHNHHEHKYDDDDDHNHHQPHHHTVSLLIPLKSPPGTSLYCTRGRGGVELAILMVMMIMLILWWRFQDDDYDFWDHQSHYHWHYLI